MVPPGTTSLVQPLDVSVNSEFKTIVGRHQNHENVRLYVEGKITASQRCILITKWVGQAWTEVCAKKDMICRACGISVPVDGGKDDLINIKGVSDYSVEPMEPEGLFKLDTDDSD